MDEDRKICIIYHSHRGHFGLGNWHMGEEWGAGTEGDFRKFMRKQSTNVRLHELVQFFLFFQQIKSARHFENFNFTTSEKSN